MQRRRRRRSEVSLAPTITSASRSSSSSSSMHITETRLRITTPSPPAAAAAAPTRGARCCWISVLLAFGVGVSIGVVLTPLHYYVQHQEAVNPLKMMSTQNVSVNASSVIVHKLAEDDVHQVGTAEDDVHHVMIEDGVYWSAYVESLLPVGFTRRHHREWSAYVQQEAVAVRMEAGCGRMQNRLVTFADGRRACVRYRQNTDQLQGELFSFYLAQLLQLPNVLPSAAAVVDVHAPLWRRLADGADLATAQWRTQRALILTEYVPNLESSGIPRQLRPTDDHRHFDFNLKHDDNVVELAQWSDLIVFDYLTANLDRVVNNMYNHQWNAHIMDAPAHNLARHARSALLVFLDNESGLMHGYRLLDKYEPYHGRLLAQLCVFRRRTVDAVRRLQHDDDVGVQLRQMFAHHASPEVRDALPTLPERSVRILSARLRRVQQQIDACAAALRSG